MSWLLIPVSWFNKKIFLFLKGRQETFKKLSIIQKEDTVIWFHCASLGEFEQGRPIIEKIRNSEFRIKNLKIVVTFFSPSGYEVRKDYNYADVVCYLPLDTKKNVNRFLDMTHPKIAFFVKYEFWPNLLKELQNKHIDTLLVSGIFRSKQVFFNNGLFSLFMKNALKTFDHFFVQNKHSKQLLNSINLNNVTVSGDTRFDRVYEITKQDNTLDFIADFVQDKHVLVAGSTWKQDEELLIEYINNHASADEKFIIAPHLISDIDRLKNAITKDVTLFSDKVKNNSASVFIIDTIGLLTKIYSYGDVAYVGGGFGVGIHNVLEPATFGLPIIIGPKYQKFQEAIDLVKLKGCFSIKHKTELHKLLIQFKTDTAFLNQSSNISKKYILNNLGATDCILRYINEKNSILRY